MYLEEGWHPGGCLELSGCVGVVGACVYMGVSDRQGGVPVSVQS